MSQMKRVAAIHDISGVGRSSLTVVLPILSAAGVECSVIPTAVLSTQTSGFEGFTFRDLSQDMMGIAEHWKKEGIRFDGFYSGYLGSQAQIGIVKGIFNLLRSEQSLVMVDPVLGDNGEFYSLIGKEYAMGMAELCGCADIILPNRTEAAFLLGREYCDLPMSKAEVDEVLAALAGLGPRQVVLTGVSFGSDDMGVACLDGSTGQVDYVMAERIDGVYYGTGDVFGSFLMGGLMRGKSLAQAARIAVDHTCSAILLSAEDSADPRLGVPFESVLPSYWNSLQ